MMFLLDTCTFLWVVLEPHRLSQTARDLCQDATNELYLSPVSAWEITLKYQLGKLPLAMDPQQLVPTQRLIHTIETLPFTEAAALRLAQLPDIHRDPFDRMLVCQAQEHQLTILTPDTHIQGYPVATKW